MVGVNPCLAVPSSEFQWWFDNNFDSFELPKIGINIFKLFAGPFLQKWTVQTTILVNFSSFWHCHFFNVRLSNIWNYRNYNQPRQQLILLLYQFYMQPYLIHSQRSLLDPSITSFVKYSTWEKLHPQNFKSISQILWSICHLFTHIIWILLCTYVTNYNCYRLAIRLAFKKFLC